MSSSDSIRLTPADFERIDLHAVPEGAQFDSTRDYAVVFYDRAREATEQGDTRAAMAFTLLGDICSYILRLDNSDQPFAPSHLTDTFHSASPDQLAPEHVNLLKALATTVTDPLLRARITDLVWIRARDHRCCADAVEAYLELAAQLEDPEGTRPPRRRYVRDLERAIQLAVQLGPRNPAYDRARGEIVRLLTARAPTETGFLSRDLLRLMHAYRLAESAEMYDTASDIAERAELASDWHRAEGYWEEAAAWVGDNHEKRREALRRVAETYVQRAEEAANRPHIGKMQAASYLQRAIEALRRASGSRHRIDELHARMIEYQREIPAALQVFSHRIDITEAVTEGQRAVEEALDGKELPEALIAFALLMPLPQYTKLRQRAEENASQYLGHRLFPAVQHNADGKVVARQRSVLSADSAERDAAIRADMLQMAREHHHYLGRVLVQAARLQILRNHPLRVHDLAWMVSNNPFVPRGREMLYAEAFYAGFVGDMPRAIHLLVHQLEHSIRVLLERAGLLVTRLDNYQIQTEQNLNKLLYRPELKELLGEDLVFALQGLLVEAFGADLRNRVAHGLMAYGEFFDSVCLYFWWLCIRMCCVSVLQSLPESLALDDAPAQLDSSSTEPDGAP